MNKGLKTLVIILIVVIIGAGVYEYWWNLPVKFFKDVKAEKVAEIEIRDTQKSKRYTLTTADDIKVIVDGIKNAEFKKDSIAQGYDNSYITIILKNADGNEIDSVILNSSSILRDDPFIYVDEKASLPIDYIINLEDSIDKY